MKSIGVTNTMDTLEGDFQTTPARPRLECFDHCRRFQDTGRCFNTKKHLPIRTIARDFLQIILNRGTDLIGQWKLQWLARLALADSNQSGTPVYVIKLKSHDIASAHAIGCHQREHSVVAFANSQIAIDGPQRRLDGWPGQRSRQLLLTINPRSFDGVVQAHWNSPACCRPQARSLSARASAP